MRDIVSCLSENSINVANPSCSTSNNCISPTIAPPSTQNAVTSIYKVSLPSNMYTHFFVKVSWFKNTTIQSLAITLTHDDTTTPPAPFSFKLNLNSRLFRKKKGSKVFEPEKVELFWDFSNAKFEAHPEPTEGFYVVVAFDSEVGLVLGDMADDQTTMKKLRVNKSPSSRTTLVSRQEHCSGHATVYATRARFCDSGTSHDILIRCGGENDSVVPGACPALWVCIDKKTVIKVKRLQWNFRGNQTIFVDGLLVDLLWDVHDWFFKSRGSFGNLAVFMFRTRSGMDSSRLWLEDKLLNSSQNNSKDQDNPEFSLLIYACKTSL